MSLRDIEHDEREAREQQKKLIALGVLAIVVLLVVLAGVIKSSRDSDADRERREKALAQLKADEHAKPTSSVVTPPPTPADPSSEADWVAKLAALTKNPAASKPKEILRNYMNTGVDRFFFDVAPLGEVEVSKKSKPERWHISVQLAVATPSDFAPSDGLKPLQVPKKSEGIAWWRITKGTFAGDFLFRTLGTIEVHSKGDVCGAVDTPTPYVVTSDCD
jgi:hypothetical protein